MLHVPVFHSNNNKPFNGFTLLFWRPLRWNPRIQSTRATPGNNATCKEIIDIMVTFDPNYNFLPVEKSQCAKIVATAIAKTAPPTPLPILCNSAWFKPYLNERLRHTSAQASTGSSPGFTLDVEGAYYSSNTASSSDATSGTGTNAQPYMFTGASSSASLTDKGMAMGKCGLTISN